MACQVTVDTSGLTSTPFGSGAPGGRVFGSLRLKATCERGTPELQLDETDDGIVAGIIRWLGGPKTYNKPDVFDPAGNEVGFVTIESTWRTGADGVGVQLNISTTFSGAQSFSLDYKCRCSSTANWTKGAAAVSFSV